MDNRKNNGNKGHSTKAVRPDDKRLLSKTERQDAFYNLDPLSEKAIQVHGEAIKAGERWAIELFYKYYFKMPTQVVTQTNINIEEKELDSAEIERIKNQLKNEY